MPSDNIFLIDRFSRNEGMLPSDEADSKQPQRSLPKILVVDDEKRIADTLSEILEMSGLHVATAYDGWDALEAAARVSSRLPAHRRAHAANEWG